MKTQDTVKGSTPNSPGSAVPLKGYKREAFVRLWLRNYNKLRRPATRNEQIYHEVRVKERSFGTVAAEFKLSHTHVGRIVKSFEKWLGETIGRGGQGDWKQRKGVTDYLHRERLRYMYARCMEEFDRSCDPLQTAKVVKVDGKLVKEEGTRRQMPRNWRWMDLAFKAEQKRVHFEYESGQVEYPPNEEQTDEEGPSLVERMISERVYLDRPPTEQELEDARTITVRLENERKLLEEERRSLMIERAEVAKLKREMEGVLEAAKAGRGSGTSGSGTQGESVRTASVQGNGTSAENGSTAGRASSGTQSVVMEGVQGNGTSAENGNTAGRASSGTRDGVSSAAQTALTPALSQRERGKEKQKPRPQFSWRYAMREDFSEVVRRQRTAAKLEAMRRQGNPFPQTLSGPPLEVKKGVFIVCEPHPNEWDKQDYREEFLRQEAEGKAARKWREPREKFRADGSVLAEREEGRRW